jgi:hypothetical protein
MSEGEKEEKALGPICRNCAKDLGENAVPGMFCCPRCKDQFERNVRSKKVMAAVCCRQSISTGTFASISGTVFAEIKVNTAFPLDQARDELMHAFLDNKELTHLMWVDSDIVLPPNLIDLLHIDAPLVSPLCWIGGPVKVGNNTFYLPVPGLYRWNKPGEKNAFTTWSIANIKDAVHLARKENRHPVVDADLVGGGCWMMDRATAEKLQDEQGSWFRLTWQEGQKIRHGEDVYFYERARDAGMKFKVHLGVECGHMKEIDLRYFGHALYGMLPAEMYEKLDETEAVRDG